MKGKDREQSQREKGTGPSQCDVERLREGTLAGALQLRKCNDFTVEQNAIKKDSRTSIRETYSHMKRQE